MSEKTESIDAVGGTIHLTERELKHPKSGKMTTYLSFSNGMDVAGAYIDAETRKKIIKFLTPKKERGTTSGK